jgi:uracil-DNA glycosylase
MAGIPTPQDPDAKLTALLAEIRGCRWCRDAAVPPLPHEPRPVLVASSTARIALCGQAPGTRVQASGVPFTDPSGDRLRAWLQLPPERFYDASGIAIVPMGFCFPGLDAKGGDRPPRPECAPRWRGQVFAALPALELLILVGGHAQRWHLGGACRRTLTETVADWRSYLYRTNGLPALVLPHPSWRNNAWLKRHSWFEEELLPEARHRVAAVLALPS